MSSRRGSSARWRPTPPSSSGSSCSGPTTSASRPTRARCAASPAPTSARRSARTCSAASPTCCCAVEQHPAMLDLSRQPGLDRPEQQGRPQPRPWASTRTSRARSSSCTRWASTAATARTTSPISRASSPAGQSATGRQAAGRARQVLLRRRRGTSRATGPCSASAIPTQGMQTGEKVLRRSGRPSRDRAAHRPQARARISWPSSRRRRSSRASRRHSSTPTAISAPSPGAGRRRTRRGTRRPPRCCRPTTFLVALMRGFAPASRSRASCCGSPRSSASRSGGRRRRQGWPEADTTWAAPSALRERLRIAEVAARQADRLGRPAPGGRRPVRRRRWASATRQAVARAETREQGLELLIMSPEFQRR